MRIGIDVGGTDTDAVLMDGDRVVVGIKSSTTEDVTSGIVGALAELDRQHPFDPADIDGVMIGTTHFLDALVEARRLAPTAAVRLALPATASLPPFVDWPGEL
ncbi:hydantoinase/oxoprolinase family protein, partial [Clavibacter michiganensis subsp. insidiosus]